MYREDILLRLVPVKYITVESTPILKTTALIYGIAVEFKGIFKKAKNAYDLIK